MAMSTILISSFAHEIFCHAPKRAHTSEFLLLMHTTGHSQDDYKIVFSVVFACTPLISLLMQINTDFLHETVATYTK